MKKLFTFLLVFSLVFSPAFCSGKREVGLKTILLGSKEAQTSSVEKQTTLSTPQQKLDQNLTQSNNLGESLSDESSTEIVSKIVTTAREATAINQGTMISLAIVQTEANRLTEEVAENALYISGLEVDLETFKGQAQDLEIKNATLEQKLDNKKSFKFAMVGANYNLDDGYGISFDTGVKFDNGLMTSVGISLPLDNINPVGALDINNYSFNTKIGFAW